MGLTTRLCASEYRDSMCESRQLFFVYGTFTDSNRLARVLDDWTDEGPAVLDGLHRVDGEYPTLAPGGQTSGRLIGTREGDRLDRYEGVSQGLYIRVDIPVAAGGSAAVYVGSPAKLAAPGDWAGDGSFSFRVTSYLAENRVIIRRTEPASE